MKHLLLLLAVLVVGYVFWTISDKKERVFASRLITKHVLRLGAMVLVLFALVYAAANLSSTQII